MVQMFNYSLFDRNVLAHLEDLMGHTIAQIPGLQYLPDYIIRQEHDQLLALIDQQPWLDTLKRRVQHYGYRCQRPHG